MNNTVPGRYTVRKAAKGKSGARFEPFDTQGGRSVKSYGSHALAVSDMSFLNGLLAPTPQTAGERSAEPKVRLSFPLWRSSGNPAAVAGVCSIAPGRDDHGHFRGGEKLDALQPRVLE